MVVIARRVLPALFYVTYTYFKHPPRSPHVFAFPPTNKVQTDAAVATNEMLLAEAERVSDMVDTDNEAKTDELLAVVQRFVIALRRLENTERMGSIAATLAERSKKLREEKKEMAKRKRDFISGAIDQLVVEKESDLTETEVTTQPGRKISKMNSGLVSLSLEGGADQSTAAGAKKNPLIAALLSLVGTSVSLKKYDLSEYLLKRLELIKSSMNMNNEDSEGEAFGLLSDVDPVAKAHRTATSLCQFVAELAQLDLEARVSASHVESELDRNVVIHVKEMVESMNLYDAEKMSFYVKVQRGVYSRDVISIAAWVSAKDAPSSEAPETAFALFPPSWNPSENIKEKVLMNWAVWRAHGFRAFLQTSCLTNYSDTRQAISSIKSIPQISKAKQLVIAGNGVGGSAAKSVSSTFAESSGIEKIFLSTTGTPHFATAVLQKSPIFGANKGEVPSRNIVAFDFYLPMDIYAGDGPWRTVVETVFPSQFLLSQYQAMRPEGMCRSQLNKLSRPPVHSVPNTLNVVSLPLVSPRSSTGRDFLHYMKTFLTCRYHSCDGYLQTLSLVGLAQTTRVKEAYHVPFLERVSILVGRTQRKYFFEV